MSNNPQRHRELSSCHQFPAAGRAVGACAALSKGTAVYFRSARLPGSGRCFEVACEPPAVYTALWESLPGHLSRPCGAQQRAPGTVSTVLNDTQLFVTMLSLYFPPYTTRIYFCPLLSCHPPAQKTQQTEKSPTNVSCRCQVQISDTVQPGSS